MRLFKNLKERVILLEYENLILSKKIIEIEKTIQNPIRPIGPMCRIIREDGWDLSYDVLKKKHRNYTPKYTNEI
jgi:hypothetical protein